MVSLSLICSGTRVKRSKLEDLMNSALYRIFAMDLLLCFIGAILHHLGQKEVVQNKKMKERNRDVRNLLTHTHTLSLSPSLSFSSGAFQRSLVPDASALHFSIVHFQFVFLYCAHQSDHTHQSICVHGNGEVGSSELLSRCKTIQYNTIYIYIYI